MESASKSIEGARIGYSIAYGLNAIDAFLTQYGISTGAAYEANPIMGALIEADPSFTAFMVVKLVFVGLAIAMLREAAYTSRAVRAFGFILAAVYSAVVGVWVGGVL